MTMQGRSPEFQGLLRAARLVAVTDATVLLLGESGTGKELLARNIHTHSRRQAGPFVTINCAALPDTLAESELFGHSRGAFTGAVHHRTGRLAAAHGGTVFLDEIGETPLAVQAKLLRFLEHGECQALGEERPRRVDARVIAATNRHLTTLIDQGTFRRDLYFRLQVAPLELPPLRQRQGDLELLIHHFLDTFSHQHQLTKPRLHARTWSLLQNYDWPGNIRELRNLCERAVIFHPDQELQPDHLPKEFQAAAPSPGPRTTLPAAGISLHSLEKELIQQALAMTGGNRTHAARLLDLSRDALLYRMKKHALRV